MSLYTDLIEAGVEVGHWQSDLYAPVNETVKAILAKYPSQPRALFQSRVDKKIWYDLAFAYDPFWEGRK
jgi:hypothetical protein